MRKDIARAAEAHHLQRFVTLTFDPKKIPYGIDPFDYAAVTWGKMRTYLERRYQNHVLFVRVLELHVSGMPHYHVLVDRFIPVAWLREAWTAVGGGSQVDIEFVDVHSVSGYLAGYITKQALAGLPRWRRWVTTARGIVLRLKRAPAGWRFNAGYWDEHLRDLGFPFRFGDGKAAELYEVVLADPP
jgi:hypothetical protein